MAPEPPETKNAVPAALEIAPDAAENVPAPSPLKEMPDVELFVEITASKLSPPIVVELTVMAGPPVAERLAVPVLGTLTVPPELMSSAAVDPDVVVRLRSVPEPSPN